MKSATRGVLLGIAVTLLTVAVQYRFSASFEWLDLAVFDRLSSRLPPGEASSQIVIVDIDEKSLSQFGRWPWPRDLIAKLTAAIHASGASMIVYDMVFAEPDSALSSTGRRPGDESLAAALSAGRSAAGYYFSFEDAPPGTQDCQAPAVPVVLRSGQNSVRTTGASPPLFEATGMTCNIPSIGVALAASGFLNAAPDTDGILRRAPLLIRYDGRNYPNLALAAYLAQAPAEPLIVEAQGGALALQFRHRRIVMDERGTMLLRFHGASGAFARFPASDLVAGSIGRRWLEGKIVLVGSSAPGLRQSAITPLDHFFPGIELHATVLDNLLHGDFLFHSAGGWFWEKVVALLLGLTATALLFSGPGAWRIAVAAAQLVLLWSAVWNSLFRDNAYFSPVPGTITLACVFLAYGIHRGAIAQARAVETLRKLAVARKFTLNALAAVMEARDAETGAHLLRTQGYTRVLCRALKRNPRFETFLTSETIELLVQLAPIHDIGKIGVPDHILRKPGPLTHEEYAFMRRHVEFGREVILRASQRSGMDDQELLNLALDIIGSHHEHWNGHGYPRGLRGDQIPIAGRVLAVVDMYDALVSRRIYKESYPHAEAKRLIQTASGSQFDPDVVEAFLRTEDHWLQIAQEFGDGGAGG